MNVFACRCGRILSAFSKVLRWHSDRDGMRGVVSAVDEDNAVVWPAARRQLHRLEYSL